MSFTSLTFWLFFALVFVLHWLTSGTRIQNLILLAGSYVFYAWLTPWYAILLGLSSVADYHLAHRIHREKPRSSLYLWLSLILNLGVLGVFKYYNFFSSQIAESLSSAGFSVSWMFVHIALPTGLSFYILKKLAYIIDVSRGQLEPAHDLSSFLLFVSFFPQIAAGPIQRYQHLMPQIESPRIWKADFFHAAWPLIVMGLFKKIVVANTIQTMSDRVFGLEEPSKLLVLAGALAFTLQILADFSAYTDLSRGIALLLGFETPANFNTPYLALTPSDFWNRWHITLSTWLRDYIFFPVRRLVLRSSKLLPNWLLLAIPPLITMFLSGLWHGSGATFILWGIYYGVLIAGYQIAGTQERLLRAGRPVRFFAWLIMFALIAFGWLIFRAPSLGWLGQILVSEPWVHNSGEWMVTLIIVSTTVAYSTPMIIKLLLDQYVRSGFIHGFYYALLTAGIVVFLGSATTDFIYFQF